MPKKYLELESTYRNRNLFPDQGSFEVQISQSGKHDQFTAVDPITTAHPTRTFSIGDESISGTVRVHTAVNGLNVSTQTKFIFNVLKAAIVPTTSLKFTKNYYVGAVICPSTGTTAIARILEWIYIDEQAATVAPVVDASYNFSIRVDTPIVMTALHTSTGFSIGRMSSISTSVPRKIFIPTTENYSNIYSNWYLFNQTTTVAVGSPRYTQISNFDMDTHLVTAVSTISGWVDTDVLVLRQSLPNMYNGGYNLVNTAPIAITSYNICHLDGTPAATSNASYINSFVRYYPPKTAVTQLPQESFVTRIIGFVVIVNTVNTVNITGQDIKGQTFTSHIATEDLIPPLSIIEIMPYSRDNFCPFSYNGSMTSQNQPVAYEVCLNSLILPNVTLTSGGRIANYPHVYVEIENIGSVGNSINSIYSNNPNTNKVVFRVPVTDLNFPSTTPFVKLTGNGMEQTIPFKINSDMRVSVKLPNGTIFQTETEDSNNGAVPNPFLQISFLFEVSRV